MFRAARSLDLPGKSGSFIFDVPLLGVGVFGVFLEPYNFAGNPKWLGCKSYCGPSRVALPLDVKYLRIPLIGLLTKVHSQNNQSSSFVAGSSKSCVVGRIAESPGLADARARSLGRHCLARSPLLLPSERARYSH
jgi:hypothetical protein